MKNLLKEFSSRFGLSPREKQIYGLLTERITTFKDISQHLSVSPNTVNNHFKSIFLKTGTRGKTELLAIFLAFVAEKYDLLRQTSKPPRVLVLDSVQASAQLISDSLEQRGFDAEPVFDPSTLLDYLSDAGTDAIILALGEQNLELTRMIRTNHRSRPIVIWLEDAGHAQKATVAELLALGAVATFEKPVEISKIAEAVLEYYRDECRDHTRDLTDENAANPCKKFSQPLRVADLSFGTRGIFVPFERCRVTADEISVGEKLHLQLETSQSLVDCYGHVAWIRKEAQDPFVAGLGVRILKSQGPSVARLRQLFRSGAQGSCIPLG